MERWEPGSIVPLVNRRVVKARWLGSGLL